jgi:hypothetical protein
VRGVPGGGESFLFCGFFVDFIGLFMLLPAIPTGQLPIFVLFCWAFLRHSCGKCLIRLKLIEIVAHTAFSPFYNDKGNALWPKKRFSAKLYAVKSLPMWFIRMNW